MKCKHLFSSMLLLLGSATVAQAVIIDTVTVGNPGNAPDQDYGIGALGAVDHMFRIGKFEVTNAQFAEFLNAVDPFGTDEFALYYGSVGQGISYHSELPASEQYRVVGDRDRYPVRTLGLYHGMRFANWMHNGQGGPGTTEHGAYTMPPGIVRGGEWIPDTPNNRAYISRNPEAIWFLPSEDEWYKAAYHQPAALGGDSDDYWLYPTQGNDVPFSDQPPGADAPTQSNTANFWKDDGIANGYDDGYAVSGTPDRPQIPSTEVGAYTFSNSYYGTFDQAGNVFELTESDLTGSGHLYAIRGGAFWAGNAPESMSAARRSTVQPDQNSFSNFGFRVAAMYVVPEPSSGLLGILGFAALVGCRVRFRFTSEK